MLFVQFFFLKRVIYMNFVVPIITSIAIITSVLNYIINPGIIFAHDKSEEKYYCFYCKMVYPKLSRKNEHCDICQICITKYDHHCGVIGKCVGKYNMLLFILLALSAMGFIISIFLVIISFVI